MIGDASMRVQIITNNVGGLYTEQMLQADTYEGPSQEGAPSPFDRAGDRCLSRRAGGAAVLYSAIARLTLHSYSRFTDVKRVELWSQRMVSSVDRLHLSFVSLLGAKLGCSVRSDRNDSSKPEADPERCPTFLS